MSRTAAMPDSWLVLYNADVADSLTWAQWYAGQWGIPQDQLLGLHASTDEHLADAATAEAQVFGPVKTFLSSHPDVAARIMGFVVGYRVPGHFGAVTYGIGGNSITCALHEPSNVTQVVNPDCPHRWGYSLPSGGRITKVTMAAGCYMTARIDAPSLNVAMAVTTRTKALRAAGSVMTGAHVYYDYTDPILSDGYWYWLRTAVQDPALAWVPWVEFDDDTQQTPNDAFRIGTHDVDGWDDARLRGSPAGPRILAYNLNSWGSTTVRSTTTNGTRYVPNAIAAGYAAAIGSTGEPHTVTAPYPDTLLDGLAQGWTLGEVFYLANPYHGFMWELLGDPFLVVPDWVPPPVNAAPAAPSGLGPAAYVTGEQTTVTAPTLQFVQSDPDSGAVLAYRIQIGQDAQFSSPVIDYTSSHVSPEAASFTVGQVAGSGSYTAGVEGQTLAPGSYYWRVRSNDGTDDGAWATAHAGAVAFVVVATDPPADDPPADDPPPDDPPVNPQDGGDPAPGNGVEPTDDSGTDGSNGASDSTSGGTGSTDLSGSTTGGNIDDESTPTYVPVPMAATGCGAGVMPAVALCFLALAGSPLRRRARR